MTETALVASTPGAPGSAVVVVVTVIAFSVCSYRSQINCSSG
jgi:hypothetical protein